MGAKKEKTDRDGEDAKGRIFVGVWIAPSELERIQSVTGVTNKGTAILAAARLWARHMAHK